MTRYVKTIRDIETDPSIDLSSYLRLRVQNETKRWERAKLNELISLFLYRFLALSISTQALKNHE